MTDLPNQELLAAISAAATAADCADPVQATAKAVEAFVKGEFSNADQAASWFALQRVKNPKLWEAADPALDTTATNKGATNPWSPAYRGKDRNADIAAWIKRHGTASASRAAAANNLCIDGSRPLRA